MKYCPNCGAKLSDNSNYCPFCGANLQEYTVYEYPKVQVFEELVCRHCGKGKMLLVDSESDIPLYMCPHCGWYYGDFLGTGRAIYYDSIHLKIGRIIKAEIKMKGYLRVNIKDTPAWEEEAFTEIAKYLNGDLKGYDISFIREALVYLVEEGVLELYREEMDKDFYWVGVRFVDSY
ncbi:MAG: zinc-ribbon domain-containing protein [Euryarchaeota archaeon]|nr:zinc-ribbon domain-containing protein [Euryarchaeota archaeon]